jgi:hypothetical protein
MRYLVIEYKGSHAISNSDRDLVSYEFSDNLDYLRMRYSLVPVTNPFNWQIEKQGFSLYHIGRELGILLIDREVISDNIYGREIYPLLNSVMRDSQLEKLL